MKVIHRIGLNATAEIRKSLALLARKFVGPGNPVASNFLVFEIAESDPEWPAVRDWIRDVLRGDVLDTVRTTFDDDELSNAQYLSMVPVFVHGYPQPETNYGYLKATYEADACPCGTSRRQVAPFRLKGEPKWGRNGIMQLNWVGDEYFVTPDVWQTVFRPHGVESRPVTDKKGQTLTTIVQLVFAEEIRLNPSGLTVSQECGECGGKKFRGIVRGFVPRLCNNPTRQGFKSAQVFGENLQAYRQVIVSQSIRRALDKHRVRGVTFIPVENGRATTPA